MDNSIPEVRELEGNGKKTFPKLENGKGMKKSFPHFGNGNQGLSFQGIPKNGNGNGKKKRNIMIIKDI